MDPAPDLGAVAGLPPSLSPTSLTPDRVLELQRRVGNAAVGRLLRQATASAGATVAPAATVPNQITGEIGEQIISQALEKQGLYVFTDWGKHVAGKGIDRIAYNARTGELWVLDNEAQFRGISGAEALTGPQWEGNLKDVETWLANNSASKEAVVALEALRANRVRRVVANAFAGETTRFTRSLFDKGLSVFDVRLGRLFTSYSEWSAAFRAISSGMRRGVRLAGYKGAAMFEGALLILAVAEGAYYVAHSGADAKEVASTIAAEAALGLILSRLPGGFMASLTIGLESDETPAVRRARQIEEAIDELCQYVPNYDSMSDDDQKAAREVLRQIIEQPLELPAPPPPEPQRLKLPGLDPKWLPGPSWEA